MPRRGKGTPEGALLRLVLDYLAARHILAFRQNSGTLPGRLGKPVSFGVAGMADVLAFKMRAFDDEGAFPVPCPLWIEVKTATGKQSELQRSFQEQVEREGHRYIICRSIEDLEAALK